MSSSVQLDLLSGSQAKLVLEEPDHFPSSYFISLEHQGGLKFWQMLTKILKASKRSVCWFSRNLRELGLERDDVTDATMRSLLHKSGYAFGIFWNIDRIVQDLGQAGNRTLMLVRDPRDVIVDRYLAAMGAGKKAPTDDRSAATGSDRDSTPGSIVDFVGSSEADRIFLRYRRFADFCRSAKNLTVFRYEDVMFTWRSAVTNLIEKLNLEISRESAFAIVDCFEVLADISKVNGSGPPESQAFRKHLDRPAIAAVEEKFADAMAYFGYAPEETLPAAFLTHQTEFVHAVSARLSAARAQCSDLAAQIGGPFKRMPDTPQGAGSRGRGLASGGGIGALTEADPALQWRLKPSASVEIKVLGRKVVMEADPSGCRPVAGQLRTGEKTLSVYGCSVTYGWAIPFEETFCSLLQSMFPTWRVENHGVDGYSGAQNLIQLQRESRWTAVEYVTFCWIQHHMLRNVADPAWLKLIGQGRRGAFPRASLNLDGKLEYRSVMLPRSDLGGVDWTELSPDPHYLDLICFALFRRAAEIVKQNGGHFFVTTLQGHLSRQLQLRLKDFGIPVVDASVNGAEYTCLPDDPHPNAVANRIYAEKIRNYLVQLGTSPPTTSRDHQQESLGAVPEHPLKTNSAASCLAPEIRSGAGEGEESVSPPEPVTTTAATALDTIVSVTVDHTKPAPLLQVRLKPNSSAEMTVLGRRVVMKIDSNGCRRVVGQPQVGEKALAVYGCSFTFGFGVVDEETFCSLLQAMFPTWRVENHGVPSHSATQNLLRLERDCRSTPADYVTFCWIPNHMLRNVADPTWLQGLTKNKVDREAKAGTIQDRAPAAPRANFPRASLDCNGKLQYRFIKFPRLDLLGIDLRDFRYDPYYLDLVCLSLFRRAAEIVKGKGGHFFITTLQGQLSQQLHRMLDDSGIAVVDATVNGTEYSLPNDWHPNALANRVYAEKIREYLVRLGKA